ncbi:hypothetical protein D3C73_1245290 [compost metagenome]
MCDDTLNDKVFAFTLTNFFTEDCFAFSCPFDAGFFHRLVNNAAKVYFWVAFSGEIIDGRALATTGQADECNNFYIFMVFHYL